MGFDYRVRFDDVGWYALNRARTLAYARGLPHVVATLEIGNWTPLDSEVWIRGSPSEGSAERWSYDVRVFVGDELHVEVTQFTDAFYVAVRGLIDWLEHQTAATLIDDDGDPAEWRK